MHGSNKARELEELGRVQLRASDSLIDLVAIHGELGTREVLRRAMRDAI